MRNLTNLFLTVSVLNFLTYLDILRYMYNYTKYTINLKLESIFINTDTVQQTLGFFY